MLGPAVIASAVGGFLTALAVKSAGPWYVVVPAIALMVLSVATTLIPGGDRETPKRRS